MNDLELPISYIELAKVYPHFLAEYISDGLWKPYDFIVYVSQIITQAILKGNGRIIVNIPPQHGKSQFISKYLPIWYLENFPKKRVILSTYEANYAESWGKQVRNEFLHNPKLEVEVAKDSKASNFWLTTEGGSMASVGIGGPITGKSGDLMIIDDPVKNWAEAKSKAYQRRNAEWFDSTLYTRKQPGTTIIVLMTRWHELDLTGYLINEHGDDWNLIRLPALAEKNDPMGRKIGEALCPERFDRKELLKTKNAISEQVWTGLYANRPAAQEGGIIKRDSLRFYDKLPASFQEIIQSWDMSFKKTTDGSYVVGQVWGRSNGNFYLIDQFRKRTGFVGAKEAVIFFSNKYPLARRKIIEAKANGPAIIDDLKTTVPGLIAQENNSSKEANLEAVSPFFDSGNVFLPNQNYCNWIKDYIEELVTFPNAANNDQVDATSQALLNFSKIKFELPKGNAGIAIRQNKEVF